MAEFVVGPLTLAADRRARARDDGGRMASVRRNYGVPAYRGRGVVFSGLKFPIRATVISSTGSHLYLRASDGRRIGPCHPTWAMDYGDGRDYGAETNAQSRAFNEWLNGRIDRAEYCLRVDEIRHASSPLGTRGKD
jgi:hypothetical protein